METVFISIPSLYDTELIPTVLDAFESAEHPERVFVGVSIIDDNKKLLKLFARNTSKYSSNIRVSFTKLTRKNCLEVIGVGSGRKRAADLYCGENYFLQCDSHTLFANGWDSQLISLHKEASEEIPHKKVVFCAYASRFKYIDGYRQLIPGMDKFRYPFYSHSSRLGAYIPAWVDEVLEDVVGDRFSGKKFIPCTKFAGGFAFGDYNFAQSTGLFEEAVFFEEEPLQSVALRANGFALVFPNLDGPGPVAHLYSDDNSSSGLGFRKTGFSYLTPRQRQSQLLKADLNWKNVTRNPAYYQQIKDYETYAKASLRYGVIEEYYIPEDY